MSRTKSLMAAAAVGLSLALPLPAAAQQGKEVSTHDAPQYIGKQATVCGLVASVKLAMKTGGAPTFINFDKPNPDQTFTVLIWGIDRPKFASAPESTFVAGKRVCVSGLVTDYKGKPEIVVHNPDEIRLSEKSGK